MNSPKTSESRSSQEEQLIELMNTYGDMVIRLAYTYVKQKQIAEDISQEVFISCYQNLGKFNNQSSYKTWLYRITINKCKDYLKSWNKRKVIPVDHSNMENIMTHFVVENVDLDRELFWLVMKLPIKHREVIILHYYEDQSIKEISEIIHINESTVKTRIHRARQKLKKTLGEVGLNEEIL